METPDKDSLKEMYDRLTMTPRCCGITWMTARKLVEDLCRWL